MMKKAVIFAVAALMGAAAAAAGGSPDNRINGRTGATQRIDETPVQTQAPSELPKAPEFKLKDLEGKDVSLKQFRGKWVVLDFWGSWCIWCVRGIPELKENYAKYKGKVEVIGIDCGDTPQQWRDAVKKYDLPWVNVYNPQGGGSVDRAYGVQGFPTKVIVTPEGRIADVTVGEDPAFYGKLDALVNAR